MISFCTYRPSPSASHIQPSIRLRCRDFTFVAFHFTAEPKARDVYETIRNLTCKLGRLEKLYAFSYQAQGPEKDINGWTVYDPVKELQRQGVCAQGGGHAWRITEINQDYQVSQTRRLSKSQLTSASTLPHIPLYSLSLRQYQTTC